MYLKSLTLKGFKSFADKTVMTFEPNLAAIVGPNGSGKSNISDAVLWVLGERNAKNLRGQYMEDVIFAGSSARKPVAVAEVELCLDNSDGTLPVDYTEVSIGRRMYRSGESEYLINGAIVRRMDVLDILHDSGLGTGTNSIISQGNLDSVLSSKPEDRRALIEEAAGVLKHKERKAKAERKLARMDINLTRVQDIVQEVERQLGPLKRKAKRALTYAELSSTLFDLKMALAVDDLRTLQTQWEATKASDATLSEQAQELERVLMEAQKQLDDLQEQLRNRTQDEGSFSEQTRSMRSLAEKFNASLLVLSEKKRHAALDLETIARDLEQAHLAQKDLKQDYEQVLETYKRDKEQQTELVEQLQELENNHARSRKERNDLRRTIDTNTAEQRALTHRIETIQAAQAALKDNLSERQARAQVIEASLSEARKRLGQEQANLEQIKAQEQASNDELVSLSEALTHVREALNKSMTLREQARLEVDESRDVTARLSAERSALEELERQEETSNTAYAWLLDKQNTATQAINVTPLTHVLHVPQEWELVVEALLEQKIRSLVVDDSQAAQNLIDTLLEENLSGTTLLVARHRHKQDTDSNYESTAQANADMMREAGYTPLLDLISVDDTDRPMLAMLLDSVFCAPTRADAYQGIAKAHYPSTFLTQEGIIVSSDGVIALCNATEEEKEQSALARRRALEEVRVQEKKSAEAFSQAQMRLAHLEEELRSHQTQSLTLSESHAQVKGRAEALRNEVERAESMVAQNQHALDELIEEQKQNASFLEKARPEADSLEEELLQAQVELTETKKALDELETNLAPIQARIVELSKTISEMRMDAARLDERVAYDERMVGTRKREIEAAYEKERAAQARIDTARLVTMRIDPFMDLITALEASSARAALELEQKLGVEQAYSRELTDAIARVSQHMREKRASYDEITSRRAEVRIEKGRLEVQVEAAIAVITEDCNTSLETALARAELENREETEQEAERLERRIKAMGVISPDAAQEYEEVQERFECLQTQLRDLRQARKSLTEIVSIIDERMKLDFLTTFDQVNENFQEIFSTLFPGGNAYLTLENPDDPETTGVEVNAHPIGKRVKKMSLLSGGEKSMTALALLFAVYRIRTTPFYILDEVEAALDDTNLRRLLAYLDTIRTQTQFIMITHQRRTMEQADILYGVSMQSDGVTKVISQKLEHAQDRQ